MRRGVYGWACVTWLAGAAMGWNVPSRPAGELPAVSGNAWGQHAPRPRRSEAQPLAPAAASPDSDALRANVPSALTPEPRAPTVPETSYVDSRAVLWGDVRLGEHVFVAPFASLRADEGTPIHIGSESSVQDGVVIHGLPVREPGSEEQPAAHVVTDQRYSVYVDARVVIEHQAQIHGPAWIETGVWIGMQALVSRARIGRGVVIEPGASVLGVDVPPERYVPAGVVVDRQDLADQLPEITASYPYRHRNRTGVEASRALVDVLPGIGGQSPPPGTVGPRPARQE